eukprot:TRINITY_DN7395_c0_g1_i1.p2 TRINITY_DN7395_c0_g1~~TRINITY_DN7395_c0_g1_i1.p2  ORF type:complete len:69 (+),score=11.86 TRINITY_DN7395_c0_g1_i1:23-208(+)
MHPEDFYCEDRDLDHCEKMGADGWVCTYEFNIQMHMSMTYDGSSYSNGERTSLQKYVAGSS